MGFSCGKPLIFQRFLSPCSAVYPLTLMAFHFRSSVLGLRSSLFSMVRSLLLPGDQPMRARLLRSFVFVFLLIALQGCGGRTYAPVSGTVTLDGKPLAKAVVTFIPLPEPGSKDAGDSASGKTN